MEIEFLNFGIPEDERLGVGKQEFVPKFFFQYCKPHISLLNGAVLQGIVDRCMVYSGFGRKFHNVQGNIRKWLSDSPDLKKIKKEKNSVKSITFGIPIIQAYQFKDGTMAFLYFNSSFFLNFIDYFPNFHP